ncbi:MAG: rhodanese-like domain-containing protein [Thermodesulfobacteriota bacterium]
MNKFSALLFILILAGCSSEQSDPKKTTSVQEQPPLAIQIPLEPVEQQQSPFTSISAQTAQKLISGKEGLLILDTRLTREIINYGAIPGSQQTSLRSIFQNDLPIPKNTPILVVCAVGGRSYAAGKIMVKHGFTEIYNLRGGLDEWKKAGLSVVYPK